MDPALTRTQEFFARHIRHDAFMEKGGDEDIFEAGLVNSLFALQLVQFVERELGVKVENEDLTLDNFRSFNAVGRFVRRKTERDG